MKIAEYERFIGRLEILKKCDYDLKDVRQHLIRECELSKGFDLSKHINAYKQLIEKETAPTKADVLIAEYLQKLKGENYGD